MKFIVTLMKSISDVNAVKSQKALFARSYLGRLPMLAPKMLEWEGRSIRVKRANKYLNYMERRLLRLRTFQPEKATALWCVLMKNSLSYQLCLFHRINTRWYWNMSSKDAVKMLKACVNKARKWDLKLDIERFYIDKGLERTGIPNGKMRPIGSPTLVSTFMSKGLTDLIYFINEPNMKRYQHGFRRNRSTHTAILEVWDKIYIQKCKNIYEFDLRAFFNNIDWKFVARILASRSALLAEVVTNVIAGIVYHKREGLLSLNEEEELKARPIVRGNYRTIHLFRKGLPQGLSMSPILATLTMDLTTPPEGLTMYADDGLIINDLPKNTAIQKVNWWQAEVFQLGVRIAPEKSRWVENEFKFLGVKFYPRETKLTWEDKEFHWSKEDNLEEVKQNLENWIKRVPQFYAKKSEGYFWDVKPDSMVEKYRDEQFWVERMKTVYRGLRTGGMYGDYKYFFARGTYNIMNSSTWCCNDLLKLAKGMSPTRIKRMNLGEPKKLFTDEFVKSKGGNYTWGKEVLYAEYERPLYDYDGTVINPAKLNSKWDWERESVQFKEEFKFQNHLKKKLVKKDRYEEWTLVSENAKMKLAEQSKNV